MVLILFLWIFPTISCSHNLFNISSVPILLSPSDCTPDTFLTIVIHTNPLHRSLRDTLRRTWAKEEGQVKVKRVFVIGEVEDTVLTNKLVEESLQFGDILQGGFTDSYRNLTYKHLLWYRWVSDSCTGTDYVLKTDDDQFVDTFHLPRYLSHLPGTGDRWFLCQVLDRQPERDKTSKWFVTEEEFSGDRYPLYCAGWSYVTTLPTILTILSMSYSLPYLWVDDLHVTGVIPTSMDTELQIQMYDWGYTSLNHHTQYREELFNGSFFTPELLVCGDVTEEEIQAVYDKAKKCSNNNCYDLIYKDHNFDWSFIAPKLRYRHSPEYRSEL